jgi:hypothetical protein
MRTSKFLEGLKYLESGTSIFVLATVIGAVVSPIAALPQNQKDEVGFELVAYPKFVDCLRKSSDEEPRARATVIRGKLNGIMILDLDAAACGFPADDPTKFTPFNGEHKADPLAMINVPESSTRLGPLCSNPDPSRPGSCNS